MKLSQSNVIFFCMFAAFVIFITLRGELPKYLDVVFKAQSSASSGSGAASASGGTGSIFGNGVLGQASSAIDSVRGKILGAVGLPDIGGGISSVLGGIFGE